MLDSVYGERHGRQHKENCRERGGFGERSRRAAGAERRLAALAAEGRRNVPGLSALQQNDNNQEKTDYYVQNGNQNDHGINGPKLFRMNAMTGE